MRSGLVSCMCAGTTWVTHWRRSAAGRKWRRDEGTRAGRRGLRDAGRAAHMAPMHLGFQGGSWAIPIAV